MKDLFEVAAGSVVGRNHVLSGKNNQDAYWYEISDNAIVAVVCDGCSEGKHSEVGAKIGARLVTESILRNIEEFPDYSTVLKEARGVWSTSLDLFLDNVKKDVVAELRVLTKLMGGYLKQTVIDYFLFTVVGFIATPQNVCIFSLGDGAIIVNDSVINIGPYPDNKPPYLAYNLLGSVLDAGPPRNRILLSTPLLQECKYAPMEEIQSILIGTDGVVDLIDATEKKTPGKDEVVGPIDQFWEDDRYFKNPDMVRRKLAMINREHKKIDWKKERIDKETGLLPDDTTLVVVRKKR